MQVDPAVDERILIEPADWVETRRPERSGLGFYVKALADGTDGGTRATLSVQPDGFVNPAHFHDSNQFQVVLEGSVRFPAHTLTAPAVHYSDHGAPYGPFVVGPDFKMAVIRTRKAKQIYMSDREGRKLRNPHGREIFGQADDVEWAPAHGQPEGVEVKQLFPGDVSTGPTAALLRCPAGTVVVGSAARCGRYDVVLDGSIQVDGAELRPYSMRYSMGAGSLQEFVTGDDGATVLVLVFDSTD